MSEATLKRATWLELLYDVAFVALIAQVTYLASDYYYSVLGLVHVFIIGYTIFLTWWSATVNRNLQERETTTDKLLVQVQLMGAFLMSLTMPGVFEGEYTGYFAALAFVRLLQVGMMLRLYRLHPSLNPPTKNVVQGIFIAAILWLISGFLIDPYHYIVAGAALLLDVLTPLTKGKGNGIRLLNLHHLQERLGLFFILVLGESLLVVALANTAASLDALRPTILFSGLIIIVALWWLYFEYMERCAGDRRPQQFFLYVHAHGFLFGSIILLAASFKNLLKHGETNTSDVGLYIFALAAIALCLFLVRCALNGFGQTWSALGRELVLFVITILLAVVLLYAGYLLYIIPFTTFAFVLLAYVDWRLGRRPYH